MLLSRRLLTATTLHRSYGLTTSSSRPLSLGLGFLTRRGDEPAAPIKDAREIASIVQHDTESLLRDVILPINEQRLGPLEKGSDKRTPLPFVFLLGNHSSGKSTFINHLVGKQVQQAGVAPTDDGFTVIAPGPRDIDQDGPSLIGDPDMGFSSLRAYGPALVHHVNLKVRTGLALPDVMLVDSPGMIDSPTDSISYVGAGRGRNDRGYDFEGSARWFAERADVILLFFDPDKPGTTGETLSVLTNSLAGMDHKLHIILNKVDQFEKTHDFARAYGSLCWNLSKVIPRKDLPRIYTMCAPVTTPPPSSVPPLLWAASLADLDAARNEVVEQVRRAPERRIDNMITQLDDSVRLLTMHSVMMDVVRTNYQDLRYRVLGLTAAIAVSGNALAMGALYAVPSIWGFSATVSLSCLTGAAGIYLYGIRQMDVKSAELQEEEHLDSLFRKQYVRELAENDESTHAMWQRVKPHLMGALHTIGISELKKGSAKDISGLTDIVENKIPALRRIAAPLHQRIGDPASNITPNHLLDSAHVIDGHKSDSTDSTKQ